MTDTPTSPSPKTAVLGPYLVSDAAAMQAADAWRCGTATARKRLTALASLAHAVDATVSPERWRSKRRATGWDVGLAVVREVVREGDVEISVAVIVGCTIRTR